MEKVTFLFFSRPGIGKTVLLSTAKDDPRSAPSLLLDFEAHTLSIRSKLQSIELEDLLEGTLPKTDKVLCLRIREWEDLKAVLNYFEDNKSEIKSIGVDSISEINYMNLRKCCKEGAARKPGISDDEPPDITHYQKSLTQMIRLIRRLRDLPQHVFISGQLEDKEDKTTGITMMQTALNGKLSAQAGHLVDCIGYYYADKEGTRILQFRPTNRIVAKDGTEDSLFYDDIENPTITKLFNIIEKADV